MADFYTGRSLIEARLRSQWTATPGDRLVFENADFDPGPSPAPFAMVEIAGGHDVPYVGRPANRLNRADGTIRLHLMVPSGEGLDNTAVLYRNARAILANQVFDGVNVQGLSAGGGRPASLDGNYHGVTAVAEFFYLYFEGS